MEILLVVQHILNYLLFLEHIMVHLMAIPSIFLIVKVDFLLVLVGLLLTEEVVQIQQPYKKQIYHLTFIMLLMVLTLV